MNGPPNRGSATEPPTRIGLTGLDAGPIARTLRLDAPAEALGALPLPFERVDVEVDVRRAGGAEIRVRGTLEARATVACRRCLAPTPVALSTGWSALFRAPARTPPDEEGVWALEDDSRALDLAGPLREELWVRAPEYVECALDCPGLCARCGIRLAEEACRCPPPEPDPRWAALTRG